MPKAVIAAGHVSDEALTFLREKGAVIDGALGLTMIELPENAEICNPGYQGVRNEYGIQWTDEDSNDPSEWIEVELYLDVNDTKVILKKSRACDLCADGASEDIHNCPAPAPADVFAQPVSDEIPNPSWLPSAAELDAADCELAVREMEEGQQAYQEMVEDETRALNTFYSGVES
jgi:hypothetical protein